MKKVLLVLVTVALLTSCGKSLRSAGGEVTGVRSVAFNEPAPYGMVLVKRGSFEMGPADKDSLWGIMPETKGVSFDAFWMDQTEVTNAKYRQFVYYVRDSIIRERLADPAYGGNDLFKITEDRYGEPVTPHLDWNRPIPWRRANEDEQRAIESVYYTNPVTGEKGLDPKQMIYKYEWYDYTATDSSANQRLHVPVGKYSGKCAMSYSVRTDHLTGDHFIILYFIHFKILCSSKMLKNLSVIISYCNFHTFFSLLFLNYK